ncbi:DUF2892 domain-containing protein [Neobacillus sp. YX16]|uniref:YgaP family membrane protein n=1 Tax=Neobacillus sp. YX16 TaxID=3047874 RepID=UPI0024C225F7|nr:DUF2892 domain-containing protein [Neobacillus sp. YX16]WHZ03464.1 DUF2892 domain-containing protein [Neobacillus sp. YX16]
MNITKNIGILNALIRITIGLTVLSWSTAKMVKFPWRDSYLLIAICGAMKVAEGIVRFCPVTALFERYQEMEQQTPLALGDGSNEMDVDEVLPYNPS